MMNDHAVVKFCFNNIRYAKAADIRNTVTNAATGAASRVNTSLRDREFVKKLLRATILGAGGAAAGGLGGSLFKAPGITSDQYGRPKRKSRAGFGALLGGMGGATVGLLANSQSPNPMTR